MKKLLLISTLFVAPFSFGGFTVPKAVHEAAAIENAKEEAKKENKPVTFLLSDKGTTCPICSGASSSVIKELKSKSVLVYVKTGEESNLPESVRNAISASGGKALPFVTVMDHSLTNTIATFAYTDDATFKKDLRDAEKKMKAAKTEAKKTD